MLLDWLDQLVSKMRAYQATTWENCSLKELVEFELKSGGGHTGLNTKEVGEARWPLGNLQEREEPGKEKTVQGAS